MVACALLFAANSGLTDGSVEDVEQLGAAIRSAELQMELLLLEYTPKHPDVRAARVELDALRERYADAMARKRLDQGRGRDRQTALPAGPDVHGDRRLSVAVPSPRAAAREGRSVDHVGDFTEYCRSPGVLACFDFEGEQPLASGVGRLHSALTTSSDRKVRARLYDESPARGRSVRMDFRPEDGADHGALAFTINAFTEGDRLTVQWRQWVSPALVIQPGTTGTLEFPAIGGMGAKQLIINEIGDPRGCSFGEIVTGNFRWLGHVGLYQGCELWFEPRTRLRLPGDGSDFDMQPGGDNVCRYRYYSNRLPRPVDYLYPTTPANLLEVPALSAVIDESRYHGCIGWQGAQWMTFRIELDLSFCRAHWPGSDVPPECVGTSGRLRYWLKYANEDKPWLVIDYPMPLRWRAGHSERFGRFVFTPYNTGEKPDPAKVRAFVLYDEIVVARNVVDLPWPKD